ncbi:MAG: ribonuclease P protein component [Bacteroidota bacterium]
MENEIPEPENYGLSKKERISNKKEIDFLFSNGISFFHYPLNVIAIQVPRQDTDVRVMVSVSRRKFSGAVDRNHLKRLMREAWRKQKHKLSQRKSGQEFTLAIALIYAGGKKLEYSLLEKKISCVMDRLISLHHHEIPLLQPKSK